MKNRWVKVNVPHSINNLQREDIIIAIDKFFPLWVSKDPSAIPGCEENEFLSHHFDFVKFNTALESYKNKSSPGMDGIDYEVIKILPTKYKLLLLDTFNEMFRSGTYPDDWKKTYIHFIP